jgi:hypothetical protein
MADSGFDLSTAKPVDDGGFDLSSAKPAVAIAKADPSATDNALRTLSLGGRALGEGVFGALATPHEVGAMIQNKLMLPALNAAKRGINSLAGTNLQPTAPEPYWTQGLSNALTSAGAPVPQTDNEKTGSAITRGVAGALTGGGLLGTAGPASTMMRTGIAGGTGAAAGEATRRLGGGPLAQFIATLGGGTLPFLGAPSISTAQPSSYVNASANVGEGEAAAESTAGGAAQASAKGGGSYFGTVGEDESAALTDAQQAALAKGKDLGFKVTPGQESGSRALQQMEAKLESQPMTSGPFNSLKSGNQRVLNRVVGKALGEDTDVLDADRLGAINDRLGAVFENTRSPNRIVVANPSDTAAVLDKIDEQVSGLLPNNGTIRDNPLVKQLESLTNQGSVNGQQLGSLTSKLGRAAYKQMSGPNGDRDLGQALYAVKDHVDDLVQSTLGPEEAQAYAAARQQYRNLMLVTSRGNIINPSTGNVSGVALANKLQQADKSGFLFGKNQSDWYNAARFAQAFKPIVGDSGTATRSMINSPLDLALSVPFNIATRLYLKTPAAAASAIAGAPAAAMRSAADAPRGLLNPMLIPGVAGGLMARRDQP